MAAFGSGVPFPMRYRDFLSVLVLFLLVIPVCATDSYIQIDPIGIRQIGEKITITARTDLAVGDAVVFEVYSTSFSPTHKSQSGEFSGATGTVTVVPGVDSISNRFSFDVDLSSFAPDDYLVNTMAVNKGVTGTSSFKVVIIVLKKPEPSFIYTPGQPVVDQPVSFDASGSIDQDGRIVRYQWDFGDGTFLTDPTDSSYATHIYRFAGRYTVGLKVMDNNEQVVWTYDTISVVLPVAPVADFSLSPSTGLASNDHPLVVTVSDQSTGNPVTWTWYIDDGVVSGSRTFGQYRFTNPGTHTVRLEVGNSHGRSTAEKQVTVYPFEITTPVTITTILR